MIELTVTITAAAALALGAGAFAAVKLRRKARPLPQAAEPESSAMEAPTARAERSPGEPRHILVVDDQPAIRMLLAELFRSAGLVVHEAGSGKAAVELAGMHPIDVVLLDLKMPDMDGVEALEAIRSVDGSVQAVMISAFGEGDKIEAARKLGVRKFFTKPFDIELLRDYVLGLLR